MSLPLHLKETLNPPGEAGPRLTTAQRSNLWPLTARGYAWWRASSLSLLTGQPFGLDREAALFRSLCCPQPGQQWLDAGTSTGFYAGVLAAEGCPVLAADLSGPMLAEARRREPSPNIDWAQMNLEASGLPDATFDGVTVGATLNETHNPDRLLTELERLTRPGGQLWLMYLSATSGPLQGLLSRPQLGGLTFPDPAWVQQRLAHSERQSLVQLGPVVFQRFVRHPL